MRGPVTLSPPSPGTLVDTRSPEFRHRLGAALDRIGHQGSSEFRDRLVAAFDHPDAINAVNIAVGEREFILQPNDPRGFALRVIQDGLDMLWRAVTITTPEVA
jgi:hypothetical protein